MHGMSKTFMWGLGIPSWGTSGCRDEKFGRLDLAQTFTMGEGARRTSVTTAAWFGTKVGGQTYYT